MTKKPAPPKRKPTKAAPAEASGEPRGPFDVRVLYDVPVSRVMERTLFLGELPEGQNPDPGNILFSAARAEIKLANGTNPRIEIRDRTGATIFSGKLQEETWPESFDAVADGSKSFGTYLKYKVMKWAKPD